MKKTFFRNCFILLTGAILVVSAFFVFAEPAFADTADYPVTSGSDNSGAASQTFNPSDITKLNNSDDDRMQSQDWPKNVFTYDETKYIEFIFSPSVPSGASISSVQVTHEYRKSGTLSGAKLEIWNGGVWHDEVLTIPAVSNNDLSQTIDVGSYINTPTSVNEIKIRFLAYRDDNNNTKTSHDYIRVSVAYTAIDWVAVFNGIHDSLVAGGINNNIDTCGATPTACLGLYFEKTDFGKITFSSSLDLTASETQTFLQNLGSQLNISSEQVSLDVSTATEFQNKGAALEMYGFPHGDGIDAVTQSELVVKNDSGAVIDPADLAYPLISNFAWDNSTGTVAFGASHFTGFFLNDTIKPFIISFSVPEASSSLTVSGITVTAHDNRGVAGYMFTETSTKPLVSSLDWSSGAPSTYVFATPGTKTLYAWVKDGYDNVSDLYTSDTVTITLVDPDIALVAVDKAALTADSIKGENLDLSNITLSLANPLPPLGVSGSTITWLSDTPAVVSNDGQTINRPDFTSGDATVTITATLTKGVVTDTKIFNLIVLKLPADTTPPAFESHIGTAGTTGEATTIGVTINDNVLVVSAGISFNSGESFTAMAETPASIAENNPNQKQYSFDVAIPGNSIAPLNYKIKATDGAGNFTILDDAIVVTDNDNPVITLLGDNPINITVGTTFNDPGVTASDNVDGDITSDIVVTGSVDTNTAGTYTITYNATDVAGNAADPVTRTVNVESPVTLQSIAITIPATKLIYTVGDALDIEGLVVTGIYSDSSTKVETITTANITGFDSSTAVTGQVLTITVGEKTTTYTVDIVAVVVDEIAPVITVPADITTSTTNSSGKAVTFTAPTAIDNVDGSVVVTCNKISGDNFPIGETTVTCGAVDSAGNASTKTFKVTVNLTQTNTGGGGGGGGSSVVSYIITASAGTNGSMSPIGLSSINSGGSQTYTITPAIGYKVADVLVDRVSKGALMTYTFSNVTGSHTISATFSAITAPVVAKNGDANGDSKVDEIDFGMLMSQWGSAGSGNSGDLNNDSIVDEMDFALLMANWGS